MSFQPKNLWMLSNSGCLPEGEMGYDGCSKVEQKRVHQWFMDADGPELFSNKKQAVEAGSSRSILGAMDSPLWHNASDFQSVSGHFSHRLFGSEIMHNANMVDRNVPSVGGGNILMGRENFGEQYALSASMGLSISHAAQVLPGDVSFGGNRKEKINRVNDSGNDNSALLEQSYNTGNNDTWPPGVSYHKGNGSTISLAPIYAIGGEHTISAVSTFGKEGGNFISTRHEGEGKNFPMGNCTKGDENILTIGLPLDKGETNFMAVAQSYRMGDNSTISMASSYEKEQCSFITMGSTYDKQNGNFISMGPSYVKGDENMISIGSMYDKPDSNVTSIGSIQDNRDPSAFTVGQNARGDDIISFSGFPDAPEVNHSDGVTSDYGAVISNEGLGKTLGVPDPSEQIQSTEPDVNEVQKAYPKTDAAPKNKESKAIKKVPTNNFPSNVKSLLSTGMLDGVPVKYVSWSREKNLKGIIKGTGYLCGCDECNFKKTLNAYEFERHANCKTKHPNNHIYFENGKTIYAVVQELKNTPQEMLFDSIQNVTGSPIDQKNFGIWKASYQAATRELQRIYGKDEVVMPS